MCVQEDSCAQDKRVQEVKPTQGRLSKEAKETTATFSDYIRIQERVSSLVGH